MDDQQKLELEMKAALNQLRQTEVQPSPYLKTRVLARFEEAQKERQRKGLELWIWRAVAVLAASACLALVWTRTHDPKTTQVYALQPYVIQIDLRDAKLIHAQVAEVELPEGVSFVSEAHPELAALKKMRLPVPTDTQGQSRLPFVVRADRIGVKELSLRILGSDGEVLQTKKLTVHFNESKKETAL